MTRRQVLVAGGTFTGYALSVETVLARPSRPTPTAWSREINRFRSPA
jgi:hypothetical protein